jgi:very-short-patch-repair endonuclease
MYWNTAWALGALAGLSLIVLALTRGRRQHRLIRDEAWPLEPKGALLSDPERRLYRRLIQALPQHSVLPQVQLLQAVRFKRGRWNAGIANRISQLSIDFLIVTPDTSMIAAIELDDGSHDRESRRAADARKTHALKSAGIPLLRWHVQKMPDVARIAAVIEEKTGANRSSQ